MTAPSNLLTHCSHKRARLAGLLCNQVKPTWVILAEVGQQTLTQPALLPALREVISSSVPAKGLKGRSQRSNLFSIACLCLDLTLIFLLPRTSFGGFSFCLKLYQVMLLAAVFSNTRASSPYRHPSCCI